jgi:hypothetical protein
MLGYILLLIFLIFIVLPIIWAIVNEDIERTNKKVEDYYKQREKEREEEFKNMIIKPEQDDD